MKTNQSLLLGSILCAGALLVTTTAPAFPPGGDGTGRFGDGRFSNNGAARPNASFDRSGTFNNMRGGSGSYNQTYNRSAGSATGTTTWNNANGTGDHTFTNTWDKSTDTGTHSSSTTYANGKSSSSQGDWTKTGADSYDYTGTHTGVDGNVTDVSKKVSDTNGVKSVDSTYTDPANGKSLNVDKTVSDTGGVKSVDTDITHPDGQTSSVDKTITTSDGVKNVQTVATGVNGNKVTSDQNVSKDGNGWIETGTITGPNGKTATDQRQVSYSKAPDGETTRTMTGSITGPGGNTQQFGNTITAQKTAAPTPTVTPAPGD